MALTDKLQKVVTITEQQEMEPEIICPCCSINVLTSASGISFFERGAIHYPTHIDKENQRLFIDFDHPDIHVDEDTRLEPRCNYCGEQLPRRLFREAGFQY